MPGGDRELWHGSSGAFRMTSFTIIDRRREVSSRDAGSGLIHRHSKGRTPDDAGPATRRRSARRRSAEAGVARGTGAGTAVDARRLLAGVRIAGGTPDVDAAVSGLAAGRIAHVRLARVAGAGGAVADELPAGGVGEPVTAHRPDAASRIADGVERVHRELVEVERELLHGFCSCKRDEPLRSGDERMRSHETPPRAERFLCSDKLLIERARTATQVIQVQQSSVSQVAQLPWQLYWQTLQTQSLPQLWTYWQSLKPVGHWQSESHVPTEESSQSAGLHVTSRV